MSKQTPQKINRSMDRTRRLMSEAVHFQQQGEFSEAESRYKMILADTPNHPDALHFLGLLKHQRDGSIESIALMRKSLDSGLLNAGYMVNFARVLQAHGQFEESIQYLRKALALSPSFVEAWNHLGQSYELLNMPFKACESYRKAYEIDSSSSESALNFIRALRNIGESTEAAGTCERFLATHPEAWQFTCLQVLCLLDANKVDAALEKMKTALQINPLSAQLHYSMGMLMTKLGKFETAKEHYIKALAVDPQFYQTYYSLAAIQTLEVDNPMAKLLEQKIQQSPPDNPAAAISAEFSLGKMLEDQGEFDQAFRHFQRGNKILRGQVRYSTAAQNDYAESILKYLDQDFMARHTKIGLETETPIFIIGMIRSGTSLVEQILAGHPQVSGAGELDFLPLSLRKVLEIPSAISGEKIAALSDASLRSMGEYYLTKINALYPGASRITDKLPGNFMLLGLIRVLFPKARIIHCRRDPLDNCISCYLNHFDVGHYYAYDLTEIGEYYRLYQRVMSYYENIIDPMAMLTIDYESIINNTEGTVRRMIEFCGLEWDPACMDFNQKRRVVKTASMYQVRQPLYSRSIGRWKQYASHIEPLRKALGDTLSYGATD